MGKALLDENFVRFVDEILEEKNNQAKTKFLFVGMENFDTGQYDPSNYTLVGYEGIGTWFVANGT